MREIVWRVRQGWVYLLGALLCLSFAYLGSQETNLQAGVQTENKQQEAKIEKNEDGNNIQKNDSFESSPAGQSTAKPETKKKTTYKYITRIVPQKGNSVGSTNQVQTSQLSGTSTPPPAPQDTAKVKITGLGSFTVEIKEGNTAFDALKKAAGKGGFSLEYETYSFGVMITSIGGKKAEGTYYWALYYNGGYSQVGASDLTLKNKDITEWRYESWQ